MPLLKHPRCPFCHEEILATDAKRACGGCMAWHHRDCWSEGGERCAACGREEPPPSPPEQDLSPHLAAAAEPTSPLERPGCCRDHPCARHAILSALVLTLDVETLRQVARRAKLKLVPDCPAPVVREVLRAVDVGLPLVLKCLGRRQLEIACELLGLSAAARTKQVLQERLLARSVLIRLLHALPLDTLRALADALGVDLSDRRWTERVRRDLLMASAVDLPRALGALRRDDLAHACRRLDLSSPGGSKAQLRRRLLDAASRPLDS